VATKYKREGEEREQQLDEEEEPAVKQKWQQQ
jgi:hypothetical protein